MLLGLVLPNVAATVTQAAVDESKRQKALPTFSSQTTVFDPVWVLIVIAGIWLIASGGGKR